MLICNWLPITASKTVATLPNDITSHPWRLVSSLTMLLMTTIKQYFITTATTLSHVYWSEAITGCCHPSPFSKDGPLHLPWMFQNYISACVKTYYNHWTHSLKPSSTVLPYCFKFNYWMMLKFAAMTNKVVKIPPLSEDRKITQTTLAGYSCKCYYHNMHTLLYVTLKPNNPCIDIHSLTMI